MPDIKDIRKEKDAQYGDPAESLRNIGLVWTGIINQWAGLKLLKPIPGWLVALMYASAKVIRISAKYIPLTTREDNELDAKVYLDIAEDIHKRLLAEREEK